MNQTLTAKQEAFANAIADPQSKGPLKAYRSVYDAEKMSDAAVSVAASRLLANARIALRVAEIRNANAKTLQLDGLGVLREWVTIATADPAELVKTRVFCCRHCYGEGGAYQWKNEDEYARAVAEVIDFNSVWTERKFQKAMPSCEGGFGFDHMAPPNAECVSCRGAGVTVDIITDTHALSPAGRKLYAGIKRTKDGLQVLMRDQDGALAALAKYFGVTPETHRMTGPNGGPVQVINADMPAAEAAKLYQACVGG